MIEKERENFFFQINKEEKERFYRKKVAKIEEGRKKGRKKERKQRNYEMHCASILHYIYKDLHFLFHTLHSFIQTVIFSI